MANFIESVLKENRQFSPSSAFMKEALVSGRQGYDELIQECEQDWEGFWSKRAQEQIDWIKPFTTVYKEGPDNTHRWFEDGVLNVSANCLDRHLPKYGDKPALIFESNDGQTQVWTYKDLHREVCCFANALKAKGIQRGDRVVVYMPMVVEAIVCMQACARIGAIHSVVFAGFSAKSLSDRIEDAGAKMVVTADEGVRGNKKIPLKKVVDEALLMNPKFVKDVIVLRKNPNSDESTLQKGRDEWWHEVVKNQSSECEPEPMGAEDPLFILYTSGSTGKPKGVLHTTGGYFLGVTQSFKWIFDYKPEDIFWCSADVGWVTGHTYICYGPLSSGATQIIFEGIPTHPHPGRFWEIIEKHKVNIFYTAPTAIRSLIKLGKDLPQNYDLSSLRLLGTVGEPINPDAWVWYNEVVGKGRCPIIDTWWQTETGSCLISPLPGAIPTKPGSCTLPLPGVSADIVDVQGNSLPAGQGGCLVVKKPWPSQLRTIWGDHNRYCKTYYPQDIAGGKYYVAGDLAYRDQDGYFWILGRMDDVLNVSGHRLGTMEIESVLVGHPKVTEAAVIGRPDELTGEAVVVFAVLHGECPKNEEAVRCAKELRDWVRQEIGPVATPAEIRFGDNLPKTRSGKIMRRLLRTIAVGESITGDTSTLENPDILQQLQESV